MENPNFFKGEKTIYELKYPTIAFWDRYVTTTLKLYLILFVLLAIPFACVFLLVNNSVTGFVSFMIGNNAVRGVFLIDFIAFLLMPIFATIFMNRNQPEKFVITDRRLMVISSAGTWTAPLIDISEVKFHDSFFPIILSKIPGTKYISIKRGSGLMAQVLIIPVPEKSADLELKRITKAIFQGEKA